MAKITDASKFLPGCMDGPARGASNLRMAQKAKRATPRPRQQFRKTFIRQWREHRGLTLERLADRVGMTAGNLSQLERGNQGYTQNTLEGLANALQTDAASLLMRDPTDSEGLWSIWDQAKPGERQMLVDIAKTVVKTGT
jgi:DNA-binding Xre family transcriptional regulator